MHAALPSLAWFPAAMSLALGCGSSHEASSTKASPSTPASTRVIPKRFLLTIHTVRVSSTRSDGRTTWDGSAPEKGDGCGMFSSLGALMGDPTGGALVGQLCRMGGKKQAETDPTAPDLVATIKTQSQTLWSPVSPNTAYADLSAEFLIDKSDVPPGGIKLSILDQDGKEVPKGELIGQLRLGPRDFLREGLQTHKSHELEELSLSIEPAEPPSKAQHTIALDAKDGLVDTGIQVRAGESLVVRARGSYVVSAWDGTDIGPAGIANGKKSYNLSLPTFKKAPHGAAVALISGNATATHATVVGTCASFTAPVSGTLSLGINDRDASNNRGTVDFSVLLEPGETCDLP